MAPSTIRSRSFHGGPWASTASQASPDEERPPQFRRRSGGAAGRGGTRSTPSSSRSVASSTTARACVDVGKGAAGALQAVDRRQQPAPQRGDGRPLGLGGFDRPKQLVEIPQKSRIAGARREVEVADHVVQQGGVGGVGHGGRGFHGDPSVNGRLEPNAHPLGAVRRLARQDVPDNGPNDCGAGASRAAPRLFQGGSPS